LIENIPKYFLGLPEQHSEAVKGVWMFSLSRRALLPWVGFTADKLLPALNYLMREIHAPSNLTWIVVCIGWLANFSWAHY
jgi:hypothetical protein